MVTVKVTTRQQGFEKVVTDFFTHNDMAVIEDVVETPLKAQCEWYAWERDGSMAQGVTRDGKSIIVEYFKS